MVFVVFIIELAPVYPGYLTTCICFYEFLYIIRMISGEKFLITRVIPELVFNLHTSHSFTLGIIYFLLKMFRKVLFIFVFCFHYYAFCTSSAIFYSAYPYTY